MQRELKVVLDALIEPGSRPQYHSEQLVRLMREWPTLAKALAELLQVERLPIPPEWR